QQLLESRGGNIEQVFSGRMAPAIRAALDQIITEARQHFDLSLALLSDVPRETALIFLPLAMVRRDLERMSLGDVDPFIPHIHSRLSILWTVWRASRSAAFRGR